MKTPAEIVFEALGPYFLNQSSQRYWAMTSAIEALDAAGYVIVPKKPTGAQRQLFDEMVKAGDDFAEIYPAVLNEWVP